MPPRQHIPDDAEYNITLDGKLVAKYCRHCGRFGKGDTAHYTKEHVGQRNRFEYKGPPPSESAPTPAPAPAPPPTAGGHMAQFCSPITVDLSSAPTIQTEEYLHTARDYDFGSMTALSTNLAKTHYDQDPDGFIETLLKELGG